MIYLCAFLYVLCIALSVYGIYKDRQYQRAKALAELAEPIFHAMAINLGLQEKIKQLRKKEMTEEEFKKSWG